MELIYVREFVVLAETCNFQAAAECLSMSQSALSKHIQRLEDDLNIALFDRSKRSAVLSDGGRIFLDYARKLCAIADECEQALSTQRIQDKNSLRIGFIKKLGQYNLIEELTDFSLDHPDIHTSLYDQDGDQVKTKLSSGECDFIFTAEADEFNDNEFQKVIYKTENMVVLIPSGHRFASRNELRIEDLGEEKLIIRSTPLEERLFSDACTEHNITPDIIGNISSSLTIMKMVSQDMGISVISDGSTDSYESFDLVKVPLVPPIQFNIYMICRRGPLSRSARLFLEYFTE